MSSVLDRIPNDKTGVTVGREAKAKKEQLAQGDGRVENSPSGLPRVSESSPSTLL